MEKIISLVDVKREPCIGATYGEHALQATGSIMWRTEREAKRWRKKKANNDVCVVQAIVSPRRGIVAAKA